MFKKYYYLAYGSNLNLEQMSERCPSAKVIGSIILNDYRLVYKGSCDDYAYLTIEPFPGASIPLGLFELSFHDINVLDKYEGFPKLFPKYYIPVKIDHKTKEALIYVMNNDLDYHLPQIEYIATCFKGYDDFDFDQDILNKALIDTMDNIPNNLTKVNNSFTK